MEFFAGLDVSMKETHVCVVDREGGIVLETLRYCQTRLRRRWRGHRTVSGSCSRPAARCERSTMVLRAATAQPVKPSTTTWRASAAMVGTIGTVFTTIIAASEFLTQPRST